MDEKKIKLIDQHLKGKNLDPVLRADLENKKEILLKNKKIKK